MSVGSRAEVTAHGSVVAGPEGNSPIRSDVCEPDQDQVPHRLLSQNRPLSPLGQRPLGSCSFCAAQAEPAGTMKVTCAWTIKPR